MATLRIMSVLLVFGIVFTSQLIAQEPPAEDSQAGLLSAFFGLDNAMPRIFAICRGGRGQDGMPIIFDELIDPGTLQASDFAVITASGQVNTPICATLSPATDEGELRTVLIIGELGDAISDPPVHVEIVGDIISSETGRNLLGASVDVTPLESGPFLVLAEDVPPSQWNPGRGSGPQQGDGCPVEGTVQVVRATWAGGVSNADGEEVGGLERSLYQVTLALADDSHVRITPFALADLGDADNNHFLCLDQAGEPLEVFFPEGYLYDPNSDTPNPDTSVTVRPLTQQTR